MVGKSLYNFPDLKTLKERNEKQVHTNFELETSKVLGKGHEFGLAMMNNEKLENHKEQNENQEINNHVQFLTDQMREEVGGVNEIFQQDPLNKKPGAMFRFEELCELE